MKTTAELEAENAQLRESVRLLQDDNKNLQTAVDWYKWIHESPARLRAVANEVEDAAAEETGGGENSL